MHVPHLQRHTPSHLLLRRDCGDPLLGWQPQAGSQRRRQEPRCTQATRTPARWLQALKSPALLAPRPDPRPTSGTSRLSGAGRLRQGSNEPAAKVSVRMNSASPGRPQAWRAVGTSSSSKKAGIPPPSSLFPPPAPELKSNMELARTKAKEKGSSLGSVCAPASEFRLSLSCFDPYRPACLCGAGGSGRHDYTRSWTRGWASHQWGRQRESRRDTPCSEEGPEPTRRPRSFCPFQSGTKVVLETFGLMPMSGHRQLKRQH